MTYHSLHHHYSMQFSQEDKHPIPATTLRILKNKWDYISILLENKTSHTNSNFSMRKFTFHHAKTQIQNLKYCGIMESNHSHHHFINTINIKTVIPSAQTTFYEVWERWLVNGLTPKFFLERLIPKTRHIC